MLRHRRTSQDHGPINTWNRAAYVQSYGGAATMVPQWTIIRANLIMNGPSGNRDLGNMLAPTRLPELRCHAI